MLLLLLLLLLSFIIIYVESFQELFKSETEICSIKFVPFCQLKLSACVCVLTLYLVGMRDAISPYVYTNYFHERMIQLRSM